MWFLVTERVLVSWLPPKPTPCWQAATWSHSRPDEVVLVVQAIEIAILQPWEAAANRWRR